VVTVPYHLSWKPRASSTSPPPVRIGHLSPADRLETPQPHYDRNQQYSIVGLTNAAGTLVERYTYSAYGTLGIYDANGTVRTSSTYANRYTYTGREWDAELNLYHFRARWYDPATGGFISRDPLGYVDGMSLYRAYFVPNGFDPLGLASRDQVEDGKLQYSCNCGWIDWSHAGGNDGSITKNLFSDVWKKINTTTKGTKLQVCYTQKQGMAGHSSGYTKCFWINTGLSSNQKKCIAWQIFKEVSEGFEDHQSWVGKPWNNSGFSPEDLVSNLILFQRVTGGFTRAQIESWCGVITDKDDNLELFDKFPWGERGKDWNAIVFTNCTPCGKLGKFPNQLLTPACQNTKGTLWGELGPGTTFYLPPKSWIDGFIESMSYFPIGPIGIPRW
jgi:RHS repeat-associated protein